MPEEKERLCCDCVCVHEDAVKEIEKKMPRTEDIFDLADFFKIFADSTRVKILCVLRCGSVCVCDIAKILELSQSAVSHQLRTLKQMKLVEAKRDGKNIFYSLVDSHIESILDQGMEHILE